MSGRKFEPPRPVGEPYRADPSGPAPFVREGDAVPIVPVEPHAAAGAGRPITGPPYVYPRGAGNDSLGPQLGRPPRPVPPPAVKPVNPVDRYARTAFWVGIVSIFIFNLFLGPIAIIMGVISIRRGEKRLGRLAILFGVIGTAVGVAYLVLVSTGVLPSADEMLNDLRNRS